VISTSQSCVTSRFSVKLLSWATLRSVVSTHYIFLLLLRCAHLTSDGSHFQFVCFSSMSYTFRFLFRIFRL
jgi:hypothetical protein